LSNYQILKLSSVKTKLCTTTEQVTYNPFFFASQIKSTDLPDEWIWNMHFPPVYSNKNEIPSFIISSAKAGIPFNP
jgi:hypothetical protein